MLSRGVLRQAALFCSKTQKPQPAQTVDSNLLSKSEK